MEAVEEQTTLGRGHVNTQSSSTWQQQPRVLVPPANTVTALLSVPTRYPRMYVDPVGFDDLPEGIARPGFFRGVTTIVTKLLNIVQPHQTFFGQKDALQCISIKKLVEVRHGIVRPLSCVMAHSCICTPATNVQPWTRVYGGAAYTTAVPCCRTIARF